jgi:hypothetical protein
LGDGHGHQASASVEECVILLVGEISDDEDGKLQAATT